MHLVVSVKWTGPDMLNGKYPVFNVSTCSNALHLKCSFSFGGAQVKQLLIIPEKPFFRHEYLHRIKMIFCHSNHIYIFFGNECFAEFPVMAMPERCPIVYTEITSHMVLRIAKGTRPYASIPIHIARCTADMQSHSPQCSYGGDRLQCMASGMEDRCAYRHLQMTISSEFSACACDWRDWRWNMA